MNKQGQDPKVKKTLVRDCERSVIPRNLRVVRETNPGSSGLEKSSKLRQKDIELNQPTLCSSVVLQNYLYDVRNTPPVSSDDVNISRDVSSKVTKKLNFHFTDQIYRNLVELNTTHEEVKTRKNSKTRPTSAPTSKKDLEPDIEDFCQDEVQRDSPPKIMSIKPKTKPVKILETGELHRLVSSFEVL